MILIVVAGVLLFCMWRNQQDTDAALGRPPMYGGADGSPPAQYAAAHSNASPESFENAVYGGVGSGVCKALGVDDPRARSACGKVSAKVLTEITKPRFILGGGPPGGPAAEFKRRVIAMGRQELDTRQAQAESPTGKLFGIAKVSGPLSPAAVAAMRDDPKYRAGFSGAPVSTRPSAAPPKPFTGRFLGDPTPPTSAGVWQTTTPLVPPSTGPAVQSRTGRGRF